MRIGVNLLFLIPGEVGGSEIYTRQILQALASVDSTNNYYIFRNIETGADIVPSGANFHDCPQAVHARSRPARIAYEQSVLLLALAKYRIDVLYNCGFTAPLLAWTPMVTVYYDLQYKRFSKNLKPLELLMSCVLLPASARRSRSIIAMSEAVRADLTKYYPWSERRITLVPHGVDPDFIEIRRDRETRRPSDRKYVLAVSTLMAHKNFDNLLRAFVIFHAAHPSFELIVVGIKGRDTERLEHLRTRLGLDKAVTFTGWLPRHELLDLFVDAEACVYASMFEGFGIPVLEALTAGIPLACSRIKPIEEIAAHAAHYFNPNDVEDIAKALGDVVDDETLRSRLSTEGPVRAQRFDSRANARVLVGVFESSR